MMFLVLSLELCNVMELYTECVLCNTEYGDRAQHIINDNRKFALSLSDQKNELNLIWECIIADL